MGEERKDGEWIGKKRKTTITKRDSLQLDSFFLLFLFVLLLFDIHPLNIHNNKFLLIKNTGNHANITLLFLLSQISLVFSERVYRLNFFLITGHCTPPTLSQKPMVTLYPLMSLSLPFPKKTFTEQAW